MEIDREFAEMIFYLNWSISPAHLQFNMENVRLLNAANCSGWTYFFKTFF